MAVGFAVALVALTSQRAQAGLAPNDYFKLELPRAALLAEPLGPPAHFAPVGAATGETAPSLPAPALSAPARTAAAPVVPTSPRDRAAPARGRSAHHHGSPLDARAAMTRPRTRPAIVRWPCKSGGICAWQNPPAAR